MFKITIDVQENIMQVANRVNVGVDNAIKKTLTDMGKFIADEARRNVPVDTGRLKTSIRVTGANKGVLEGGAFTEYARFVEFGTRKQRARYYMTNAVRAGTNRGETQLAAEVKRAIGAR